MKDRDGAAGAALVEWINNLPVPGATSSMSSLNDGLKIWKVLRDLDPEYFVGDLPEGLETSSKWVSRWQNLKHISKALISYITDVCGQSIPQHRSIADLKLIATDGHLAETVKAGFETRDATLQNTDYATQLLKLVLIAAINSPKSHVYVTAMLALDEQSQQALRDLIEDMQDSSHPMFDDESPQNGAAVSLKVLAVDQELLFEEKLGKVMADNENIKSEKRELEKDLQELHNRLARLQTNNDVLQDRLIKAEDSLKQSGSARGARGEPYIKELETRIQEQEDLIANQEVQISDYRITLETSTKALDRLQKHQEREQSLQDELDVTRVERDSLAKKANTLDKYKQKLQSSQGLEKENQLLKSELEEVRQQYQETEQTRQELAGLERAVEEYKRILSKTEQDCHDLQVMKKQLEFNNATLAQRCEKADTQHLRNEEIIADLQVKSQALDSRRVLRAQGVDDLDAELDGRQEHEELQSLALKGRVIELSKSYAEVNAKAIMLQKLLDDANGKYKDMEKKYFVILEQNMVLHSALKSGAEGQNPEGSEPLLSLINPLTHSCNSTESICDTIRSEKNVVELRSELALIQGALQAALRQSEVESSLISNSPFDVVDILSKFNYKEVAKLRKENAELRSQVHAGRTKDDDRSLDGSISNKDLKALLDQIESASGPDSKNASISVVEFSGNLQRLITEVRERAAKRQQHIEHQDGEIKHLRERLQQAEAEGHLGSDDQVRKAESARYREGANTAKTAIKRENEMLRRENKLIATAFHDLSGRLHMNTVTLQRRTEAKSYLNKQRQAVNKATSARTR